MQTTYPVSSSLQGIRLKISSSRRGPGANDGILGALGADVSGQVDLQARVYGTGCFQALSLVTNRTFPGLHCQAPLPQEG